MPTAALASNPVLQAALTGLTSTPKWLPPWLFYDERGSELFEAITGLPEYYLTRTERSLIQQHADAILKQMAAPVTIAELGAGTATKTGLLLQAATRSQAAVLYQPIDISPSALDEAALLAKTMPSLTVRPQVANYITEPYRIERPANQKVLALYIGSSIGNFSPAEARAILHNLRSQLHPGDALLLGTDLAPGPNKPMTRLLAAYDDAAGVTAAFNRNILAHLNHDLGTGFDPACFRHEARWNAAESRIEMHLQSTVAQTVLIPASAESGAVRVTFTPGETIHTENSYKFTLDAVRSLLGDTGFGPGQTFTDAEGLFGLTLAPAVA